MGASKVNDLPSPGGVQSLGLATAVYRAIYLDPPWRYSDSTCQGAAEMVYPTMSVEEITSSIPIDRLRHPDGCALWMWATWPKLRDRAPHEIIEAWGFRWVSEIVWNKMSLGLGRWLRSQTEVLILAVRGDVKLKANDQRGYIETRRTRHSVKPECARHIITRLCEGPYLELFARRAAKGWDRWGNEAQ